MAGVVNETNHRRAKRSHFGLLDHVRAPTSTPLVTTTRIIEATNKSYQIGTLEDQKVMCEDRMLSIIIDPW